MIEQDDVHALNKRIEALEDRCEELRSAIVSVMNLAVEASLLHSIDHLPTKLSLVKEMKGRVNDLAKLLYPKSESENG